jgi:hypothetical protein
MKQDIIGFNYKVNGKSVCFFDYFNFLVTNGVGLVETSFYKMFTTKEFYI